MNSTSPAELLGWFGPVILISCVWIVAAILALVRWQRHPTVSLLVLLGCLLLLVSGLGGSALQYALIKSDARNSGSQFQLFMAVVAWGRTFLSITAYVLLICALFGWRRSVPLLDRFPDRERELRRDTRDPDDSPRGIQHGRGERL